MFDNIAILTFLFIGILSVSTLGLLYYYLFVFSKLAFYKPANYNYQEFEPVSIIISARNEYRNLEKNLKSILEQDYPNFEVIVINDCSWDDSQKLLEYYQEVYPNLKICKLIEQEKYPTGKKFALTIGIKAAKHDKMLFTDADCKPSSNQWLKHMQAAFTTQKEIVLGFSPYKYKPGFLNLFIRYEAAITALSYFSAALKNNAFMGVGRNLAYTKDVFFKQKGFANHQHILSGDDDLFVNEAANANNVAIQLNPESFMLTEPKTNFAEYSRQKSRHMTTGKFYKSKHKFFLGAYYFFLILFYPVVITLFFTQPIWLIPTCFIAFKLLVQTTIFYMAFKKLNYKNIAWFLLLLDFVYFFYILYFGFKGLVTKHNKTW